MPTMWQALCRQSSAHQQQGTVHESAGRCTITMVVSTPSPAHLAESVEELLAVLATLIGSNHTPSSSDHTLPDAAKYVCTSDSPEVCS